jgi:hypothetical protein
MLPAASWRGDEHRGSGEEGGDARGGAGPRAAAGPRPRRARRTRPGSRTASRARRRPRRGARAASSPTRRAGGRTTAAWTPSCTRSHVTTGRVMHAACMRAPFGEQPAGEDDALAGIGGPERAARVRARRAAKRGRRGQQTARAWTRLMTAEQRIHPCRWSTSKPERRALVAHAGPGPAGVSFLLPPAPPAGARRHAARRSPYSARSTLKHRIRRLSIP